MVEESKNLFFFFGEEDYLIEKEIINIGNGSEIEKHDADSTGPDAIIQMILTPSLFQPTRTIVLRDYDDDSYLSILQSVGNIPYGITVIIVADGIDKRSKLYKLLSNAAVIKEFKAFSEWETQKITAWINVLAKENGKTINEDASVLLSQICGKSLRQLNNELIKIATYIGEKKVIDKKDVETMAISYELNAFALENALAEKDIAAALNALDFSMKGKIRAEMLIGKLYSKIKTYLLVKSMKEKKISNNEIMTKMGMGSFYFGKIEEALRHYSLEDLLNMIKSLSATDIKLKSSGQSQKFIMEMLLTDIMVK